MPNASPVDAGNADVPQPEMATRGPAVTKQVEPTKQVYGVALTKLIKKVKKIEKTAKSCRAKRRARMVVSDDEDDLEDPSKHGWMIAKIDQDPDISLVQDDVEN
ncbi:hypothetical protein CTI12_AA446760 [Artemisia annua]|uniref:Uncharacterized protein n=1 Tax=Artemisia annua TaxID=35608 RepID=A0A2U1LW04_ARTAN|nr:hypothetical protein CTI12_AA446760 [Artemisia annua]